MKKSFVHVAVIPARAGSVGLPGKNRLFFDQTADFLDSVSWFDQVVVTSDDEVILDKAQSRRYASHTRPKILSGSDVSIKTVFDDLILSLNCSDNIILWLFYLPILYKRLSDFEGAKKLIEIDGVNSVCTFVPVKTHPFNTWKHDLSSNQMIQYVSNDVFRRQDLPPAWMHYHYVCCFQVNELPLLNSELINPSTRPIFLAEEDAENLIEVDTPQDFERWRQRQNLENTN
jgi:CMP-N-acetylneuraminic acid synthetase